MGYLTSKPTLEGRKERRRILEEKYGKVMLCQTCGFPHPVDGEHLKSYDPKFDIF